MKLSFKIGAGVVTLGLGFWALGQAFSTADAAKNNQRAPRDEVRRSSQGPVDVEVITGKEVSPGVRQVLIVVRPLVDAPKVEVLVHAGNRKISEKSWTLVGKAGVADTHALVVEMKEDEQRPLVVTATLVMGDGLRNSGVASLDTFRLGDLLGRGPIAPAAQRVLPSDARVVEARNGQIIEVPAGEP